VWAAIWAAITVPWVRSAMAKEKKSWEEDSASVVDAEKKPAASAAVAPGPLAEKVSESSTLRGSTVDRHDGNTAVTNDMTEQKKLPALDTGNVDAGASSSKPSN
jgi:hypothetical protein